MSQKVFSDAFQNTVDTCVYNPKWENGTGYLNGAVTDRSFSLENGEMCKSIDPAGRRILIIQTRLGRVVLFDRRPLKDGKPTSPIVLNADQRLTQFGLFDTSGGVGEADMCRLVGSWGRTDRNLGVILEEMRRDLSDNRKPFPIFKTHSEVRALCQVAMTKVGDEYIAGAQITDYWLLPTKLERLVRNMKFDEAAKHIFNVLRTDQ